MHSFLERYQQGDYKQVWKDLLTLSQQVRQEPTFSDALATARETMTRLRRNLEVLVYRLNEKGYQFQNPASILLPPSSDIKEKINYLEQRAGVLPLSLRAFYEVVGSVDLTGGHPVWKGCEYPDALVIFPIESALNEVEDWEYDKEAYEKAFGSFRVPLAPDAYLKENVSGGMWYGIALPNLSADAVVLEEWHRTTLLNYLRICLRWGGFPGLARAKKIIGWPVSELGEGLLNF